VTPVKAILWDNDGVLVDTEHLYFEATRFVLRELGVELSEAHFVELSLGVGRSCFEVAAAHGISAERIESARLERNHRYSDLLAGTELIPGVRETLEALHGRVSMAVVTSSRPEHFALQHASTGARRYFDFVLTGADVMRHKPDPEPYLVASRRLGIAPADCLVIEDSERGLLSAVRAGMRCAVVPRGLSTRGDFSLAWRRLEHAGEVTNLVAALRASALSPRPPVV
jgi:HAD superfamily hydrolase (TIGR01509 family)